MNEETNDKNKKPTIDRPKGSKNKKKRSLQQQQANDPPPHHTDKFRSVMLCYNLIFIIIMSEH